MKSPSIWGFQGTKKSMRVQDKVAAYAVRQNPRTTQRFLEMQVTKLAGECKSKRVFFSSLSGQFPSKSGLMAGLRTLRLAGEARNPPALQAGRRQRSALHTGATRAIMTGSSVLRRPR